MQVVADRAEAPTAIQTDLRAIFVSLELSRSTWLITSLSPGGGEKMSKHSVQGGDIAGLFRRFAQRKATGAKLRAGHHPGDPDAEAMVLSRIHTTHPHMAESPWRATACGGIMSGQSWIEATAEQRAELRGLAGSSEREEAGRARAILLSLDGWTSERIAAAFCAQPDSVRHWRWIFGREGVAGLRARKAPGPEPVKARAALSVIEDLLAPGVSDRPNWTLPRLADEIEKRTGERISKSRLSVVVKKGASPGAGRATR